MYDLLNMNVHYLKHRIKVLECLKYKTDAKNMENFSVRLSEYFDELRDLMYIKRSFYHLHDLNTLLKHLHMVHYPDTLIYEFKDIITVNQIKCILNFYKKISIDDNIKMALVSSIYYYILVDIKFYQNSIFNATQHIYMLIDYYNCQNDTNFIKNYNV